MPKKWEVHPDEYESPWGWITRQLNTFRNFLHTVFHPHLLPPWTLRKYFHVLGVTHRCMKAWRNNHYLLRKNKGDVAAFGLQAWQTGSDLNADPNWEVHHRDEAVTRIVAVDEDDRCDSDPPKRR